MKVGIFTFHHAHNYGALLQVFALKTYLEHEGYNVEIIEYVPDSMKNIYSINPLRNSKSILEIIKKTIKIKRRYKQYVKFCNFIKRELECTGVLSWTEQAKECDVLITGSDQVWNTNITYNNSMYFLPFDKDKVKLSYAASIGTKKNIDILKEFLEKYVTSFNGISVRESSSVEIIESILKIKPTLVCDPVFLLSKSEWSNFSKDVKIFKEKYILYYSLEFNKKLYDETVKLAKECNLKIYGIHPMNQSMGKDIINLRGIGPYEFVSLIDNAEYVSTNSFHALAFSIIFEKSVLHYHHKDLGIRTVDLLKLMEKNESNINGFILAKSLNYENLETLINNSKEFLSLNINSKGGN